MKHNTRQPHEQADHEERDDRAVWEPPIIRAVGTIAELVQVSKTSGDQDCGGKRRIGTGGNCGKN